MYKDLQSGSRVLLISGNEEIKHARNWLLIRILDEDVEREFGGFCNNKRDNTCMSMTKMTEENSERPMPRESRIMLPGQSHISRGMTVLADRRSQERQR